MDGTERAIWFLGDLDDPWVSAIFASVSCHFAIHAVMCSGEVPELPFDPRRPPQVAIVHRTRLSAADVSRLEAWRPESRPNVLPRIILCFSPFVRYAELERCGRSVEIMIGEATAAETLGHHLARLLPDRSQPSGRSITSALAVDVTSSDQSLRSVLHEALVEAGFQVTTGHDLPCERGAGDSAAGDPVVTVWDVPVLEQRWPELLRRQSRFGPVIALLGFADRLMVDRARCSGVSACLDLPVDLEKLVLIVKRWSAGDRLGHALPGGRLESPHVLPPPPVSRASRGLALIRSRTAGLPRWPEPGQESRIKQTEAERDHGSPALGD
jgi:hypothetical protein